MDSNRIRGLKKIVPRLLGGVIIYIKAKNEDFVKIQNKKALHE